MTEKQVEAYLRERVRAAGGKAFKFISPGNAGVPDRLVCLPGGQAVFVELKAPGKTPTVLQRRRQEELRRLGFRVEVLDSLAAVDGFVRSFQEAGVAR